MPPAIRWFLFSPTEPRLRAGWRLAGQFALMFSILVVLSVGLILLRLLGVSDEIGLLVNQSSIFVAVMISLPLARRFLDRRSFSSLGLGWRAALPDLLAGFVIAGVLMGAIFLVEIWLGWAVVAGAAWETQSRPAVLGRLLLWFGLFAMVGWHEELLTRGYWLQNIAEGTNLLIGVLLSSAMFGFMHAANPGASWIALIGLFLAGLFLAYGYLFTKQLWLPIGLHIGWNFFEGNVFGFPVSGLDTFRLLQLTVNGPELWTGGVFGPEAGLIVIPALLLGAGLMWGYAAARRRWVAPES